MKIAVIHDDANVFRSTPAYARLAAHEVSVAIDASTDPYGMVAQVADCDALVLTQQRVAITRSIVERLPRVKFISQTGAHLSHLDIEACTEHGIVISTGRPGDRGTPYTTTGELAWGLILASLRHIPYEVDQRALHAATRLCRAPRLRNDVRLGGRFDSRVCGRQADQRRESGGDRGALTMFALDVHWQCARPKGIAARA